MRITASAAPFVQHCQHSERIVAPIRFLSETFGAHQTCGFKVGALIQKRSLLKICRRFASRHFQLQSEAVTGEEPPLTVRAKARVRVQAAFQED